MERLFIVFNLLIYSILIPFNSNGQANQNNPVFDIQIDGSKKLYQTDGNSSLLSVREAADSLHIFASYNPESQYISIVGVNKMHYPVQLNGSLENLPVITRLEVFFSDVPGNLRKGSTIQMIGKNFTARVPAGCFFTISGAGTVKTPNPEPAGWYAGDMHVHLDCNGPEVYSEDELTRLMEPNDLAVISVLADVGTGTLIDSKRDLPKVSGTDAGQSRPGRIIHWDTEWLWWDSENVQTLALGGHLALLGLKEAYYIGEETPWKVFEWSRKQNAVNGFVHMQYLNDSIQDELNCCMPIDYPVEAALGTLDFISEDVYGRNSLNGGIYNSEAAMHAYYKLLNCGFRLGLAAGTDYPCNEFEPLGALLTYVKVPDELTYRKWIDGIKNGETVVSRNGHKEFIEFTVNGRYGPGADIKTENKGSVDIEVKWTAVKELTGRIELVKNGKVVATLEGTTKPGEPLILRANAEFEQSGWLCARRMEDNEHMTHSAPVYVTVNDKPVRASAEDAQFFVSWIDNILKNTAPGGKWRQYFTHDVNKVRQRYQKARDIYSNIAKASK